MVAAVLPNSAPSSPPHSTPKAASVMLCLSVSIFPQLWSRGAHGLSAIQLVHRVPWVETEEVYKNFRALCFRVRGPLPGPPSLWFVSHKHGLQPLPGWVKGHCKRPLSEGQSTLSRDVSAASRRPLSCWKGEVLRATGQGGHGKGQPSIPASGWFWLPLESWEGW